MSAVASLDAAAPSPDHHSAPTAGKGKSTSKPGSTVVPISPRRPKFDAWDWEPRIPTAYQSHVCSMKTRFGQRTLRALYPRLQLAAFGLSVTLPILTRDDADQIDAGEASFQQAYLSITSAQKELSQRYEEFLDSNAVKRGLSHNQMREFAIKAFSPNANRALSIFIALDRIVVLVDELWYAGVFTTSQAKRAQMEAVSQVKNFVNAMDGLWKRSKAAIQRAGNAQAVQTVSEAMGSAFGADLSVPEGEDNPELSLDAHGDEASLSAADGEAPDDGQKGSISERRSRKRTSASL